MPDNRVVFTSNVPQEMAFKVDGVPEVGPVGDTVRFDLDDYLDSIRRSVDPETGCTDLEMHGRFERRYRGSRRKRLVSALRTFLLMEAGGAA